MIALIVGALIAVAAVVIVSLPFLRSSDEPELLDTQPSQDRLALLESRDRALAALKELEFDHRTGKVDDVDYRALVGPLRRAAAEALQELDRLDGMPKKGSAEEGLPEQEDVERDDQAGDDGGGDGRPPAVHERAHQGSLRGEAGERDQRERDPEAQNDL